MRRVLALGALFVVVSIALPLSVVRWLEDDASKNLKRAQELMAWGRPAEAIAVLDLLAGEPSASPLIAEARLYRVRALMQMKEWPKAAESARALYEALPGSHVFRRRAHLLLAEVLERQGQSAEAAAIFGMEADAVLSAPEDARIASYYLELAKALEIDEPTTDLLKPGRKANPSEAAALYERALQIVSPGKPHAPITMPRVRNLMRAGQSAAAVSELGALLSDKTLEAAVVLEARMLRARGALDSGDLGTARLEVDRLLAEASIDEHAEGPAARRLLGEIQWRSSGSAAERLESQRAGAATWRAWLDRFPTRSEASEVRRELAHKLREAGMNDEAVLAFEAVAEDEKAPASWRAEARFARVSTERALGRFDDARATARKFLALHPDDPNVPAAQRLLQELWLEKAAAQRTAKDATGAVATLRAYLDEYPGSPSAAEVALEIGLILHAEKKNEEAAAAFVAVRDRYRQAGREVAARAALILAVMEEDERRDLDAAVVHLRKIGEEFGGTQAAAQAASRLANLEAIELELGSPRVFVPGETCQLDFATRNVKDVQLRIYRLDGREIFERKGDLNLAGEIEVALVKADVTQARPTPDYRPYARFQTKLPVELEAGKPLPSGAYLVSAETDDRRSAVLVLVSGVRIVVKNSPSEAFCWATDARTGEPLSDVLVLAHNDSQRLSGKTDADGVVRFPVGEGGGKFRILASHEGGVVPGLTAEAPAATSVNLVPRVAFTMDRPIYQPGSEVRFRAVLRAVENAAWVAPKIASVRASLHDPSGAERGASQLEMGAFGVVSGGFPISKEAPVGKWRVRVHFEGQIFDEEVVVSSYRRPEYDVSVDAEQRVLVPGELAKLNVAVAYFFGGPVKSADFEWRAWRAPLTIDTTRYQNHAWYLKAVEAAAPEVAGHGMEFVASGQGRLNDSGTGRLEFRTREDGQRSRYVIEVMVKDTGGQWVAGVGTVFTGSTDRFAVVVGEKRSIRAGESAEVRVLTADLGYRGVGTVGTLRALWRKDRRSGDGEVELEKELAVDTGMTGETTLRFNLDRAGEYSLRFEGKDGRGQPVVAETALAVAGERPDLAKEAVLRLERGVILGGETAKAHLNVPTPERACLLTFEGEKVLGFKVLRPKASFSVLELEIAEELAPNVVVAVATNHEEKLLTASDSLVVLRYLRVGVKADPATVAPRSAVNILIETLDQRGRPVPASVALKVVDHALSDLGGFDGQDPRFVFNRDRRPHLVSTSSSFGFQYLGVAKPLDPDLIRLANEAMMMQVRTELADKSLITLFASQTLAMPDLKAPMKDALTSDGQLGRNVDLRRQRSSGRRPAGGGGGADIPGAPAPAPKPGEMAVVKDTELVEVEEEFDNKEDYAESEITEDSGSAGFVVSSRAYYFGEAVGQGGGRGKNLLDDFSLITGGLQVQPLAPVMRADFREVAAWHPALVTDESGRAQVKVDLPDNLTRWDVQASGVDRSVSAGRSTTQVLARQDVVARLERPRLLTHRDVIQLPVGVHNHLAAKAAFDVALRSRSADRLSVEGSGDFQWEVDAGASIFREVSLRAHKAGSAELTLEAKGAQGSDALTAEFPVVGFGTPWQKVEARELLGSVEIPVRVEGKAIPGTESYALVIQSGLAVDLEEALGFLRHYPYGCLEQTISRVVPMLELGMAAARLGSPSPVLKPEADRAAARLVSDLRSYLLADGQFAYWPNGPAHPYATALARHAVTVLVRAGYQVDSDLHAAAANGVARALANPSHELDAKAALILAGVQAGIDVEAALNAVFRERESLSVPGIARLLLATHALGRPAFADPLAQQLRGRRQAQATWPYSARSGCAWHASPLEATALALSAMVQIGAAPAETEALAEAVQRGLRSKEGSTKAVAAGVEALAAWMRGSPKQGQAREVSISIDGKSAATGKLGPDAPKLVVPLPLDRMTEGDHVITIRQSSPLAASARVLLAHRVESESSTASGNVLEVERGVFAYTDPDQPTTEHEPGYSIIRAEHRPKRVPPAPLSQALRGKKVTVRLSITAREESKHLVIRDPILAGLEPIASGVRGAFDRFEARGAEMVFFRNHLQKGQRIELAYPCYVVFAGEFHGLSATAEEMYAPERFGRSASNALTVVAEASRLATVPPRVPTPDERWSRGRRAFAERDYRQAAQDVEPLLSEALEDGVLDQAHDLLVRAYLRTSQFEAAITTIKAIDARSPGRLRLDRSDREKLGRAYLGQGDHYRATGLFRTLVLEGYQREAEVSETLFRMGLHEQALAHEEQLLWRYPQEGPTLGGQAKLAEWQLQLPDPRAKKVPGQNPRLQSRWPEAFATWMRIMAWHTGEGVAESAAMRRLQVLGELQLPEAIASEAERFLAVYPKASSTDRVLMWKAESEFARGLWKEARSTADRVYSLKIGPNQTPSPFQPAAGFLLGRLAHVEGKYQEAVEWYGKVRTTVSDAAQSWAFFTARELEVPAVTRSKPGGKAAITFEAKNLKEVRAQLYPVDLGVLFAVKKSFDRLHTADLSGIRPASELKVETKLGDYLRGPVDLDLGSLKPGAYLVVLRGEDRTATTLHLVSNASLTVQRSGSSIRVYCTGEQGAPIAKARLKLSMNGRIFHAGESDERGLLDVSDPGSGTITVVAEKGDLVAVTSKD